MQDVRLQTTSLTLVILELVKRPHTKRHILIHIAEGAFVVSAALSHGYKHSVCLYRRTVDISVVIHNITSFLIFYISHIIELFAFIFELQA